MPGSILRTNINLPNAFLAQGFPHFMGKLRPHVLSASMYRYAVNDRVTSTEVNIFKRVRRVRPSFHDLTEVDDAAFLDEHGLPRKDVLDVAKTKLPQSNGLGGEEIILRPG